MSSAFQPTGFVHLHNHTEFSALDGASKLEPMVDYIVEMGQEAVAITDHGSGSGWYKFADICRKRGVKPIIGIEAYITADGRNRMDTDNDYDVVSSGDDDGDFDPTQTDSDRRKSKTKKKFYEHITLIAKDATGWRNLISLVNKSARSYKYKPRMDYDLLAEHSEGIICLTGCLGGPVLGYVARALEEPRRIERRYYELIDSITSDFVELMKEYRGMVSRGYVVDGEMPLTKKKVNTFKDSWTALANDGFVPKNPFTSVTMDEDYRKLGELSQQRLLDKAENNLVRLIGIFGRDNVFAEIMEHGIPMETRALPLVAEMADAHGVLLVATNDAHYTRPEDAQHHEHLLSVQRDGFSFHGDGFHLRSESEMRDLRDEDWWQEAVSNSIVVADMCEDIVPLNDGGLPRFPLRREEHHGDIDVTKYEDTPQGHEDLLWDIIDSVRERKGDDLTDELEERLNHEMDIVSRKGFVDYFLMVWDLLLWSRSQGIYNGRGRGSVAGSAMAYYCEISWVDPIRRGLLFERFLEEDRPDYPDMDLDFEKHKRARVMAYIMQKYGRDHVASIGTFSKALSKRTVKDVMRVFGAPANQQTPMTKTIPMDGATPRPLNALIHQPEGASFLDKWEKVLGDDAEEALQTALAIEGLVVGESVHACGTLISDRPISDLIPLRKNTKKTAGTSDALDITQWEAPDIEQYGLLKLDILGLRNLDIVAKAIENIEARTGEKIDIDYGLPDPDDLTDPRIRKTYSLFHTGRLAGVFQMESSGMIELAMRLRPEGFENISAIIALYRPGPMGAQMHTRYADRKNGREEIDYSIYTEDKEEQKWIASVLGETYGTFVYQEQLMALGTLFAGFDGRWRNKLRKATAKKKKEMLDEVGEQWFANYDKEFFKDGELISPVFSRQTAERMWEMMQESANYLFNKAHSAAYGMLTFITAYLKANYTAEYCAAILAITDGGKADKRRAAFSALHDEGIEILPPDVNRSRAETFPVDDNTVIIGLQEIKGLGEAGAHVARIRHRSEISKDFTSLNNLARRVLTEDGKPVLSTSDLEKLIQSGACDEIIGGNRMGAMMVSRVARTANIPVPPMEWGAIEKSARQRALLGVSVGESPLRAVGDQLRDWRPPESVGRYSEGGSPASSLADIPYESDLYFTSIGILSAYSERDYSGGRMANLTLEGSDVSFDGVMFSRAMSKITFEPRIGQVVAASGYTKLSDWSPVQASDDDGNVSGDLDEEAEEMAESEPRLELTINSLWLVDVDDPVTGTFKRADLSWSEAVEEGNIYDEDDSEDDDGGDDPDGDDPNGDDDPIGDDDPDGSADVIDSDDDRGEPSPEDRSDEGDLDEGSDDEDLFEFLTIAPVPPGGSPRESAPLERHAPVTPIAIKQVVDGRKVPILYREFSRNDRSAYSEIDPTFVSKVDSLQSSLHKRAFMEGSKIQVEKWFEINHRLATSELKYIRVVTISGADIDLTALPALYDTNNGTTEPNTLADLFPERTMPPQRKAK